VRHGDKEIYGERERVSGRESERERERERERRRDGGTDGENKIELWRGETDRWADIEVEIHG
jgi:hypothetical protein